MKSKRLIVFLVTAVVALSVAVGVAFAANQAATRVIFKGQGMQCEVRGPNVVCALQGDPRGDFGVGISRDLVMVMRFDRDGSNHVVFKRYQP